VHTWSCHVLITVQCELQSTVNWTLTPYKTTIYGEHRHRDNYVAHLCFVLTAWSTSHSQSNSLHTHSNKSNSQARPCICNFCKLNDLNFMKPLIHFKVNGQPRGRGRVYCYYLIYLFVHNGNAAAAGLWTPYPADNNYYCAFVQHVISKNKSYKLILLLS
jgi:hypothetical protein